MRTWLGWCFSVILLTAPARADDTPQGKLLRDTWDAAYLASGKVGYYHTTVREIERDGEKRLRTTLELRLTLRRFDATVQLRAEQGTEETADGTVTAVFSRMFLDKGQELVMNGEVTGNKVRIRMNGGRQERIEDWDNRVVGMDRQERLFRERQVKPGDQLAYRSFEPAIQSVVTVRVNVKDEEDVQVLGKKQRLLRVETVADPVEFGNGKKFQLPGMTVWLDKNYQPVRSETEQPPLGKIVLYRTTREVAMRPAVAAKVVDIGLASDVPLNRPIPSPHDTTSVVYRMTLRDGDAAKAFAADDRQQVTAINDKTCEVRVRSVRVPPARGESEVKDEYLKSNFFITSDDAQVQAFARRAVGDETDPWRQAQRIERWVHDHMKNFNPTVEFTTAARVAQSLEGDCRHHAVLTAAMCRAAGVPSRTALGLVYVNKQGKPVLGFHMWTEVFVRGQWLGLDATLGRGYVGAGHVKITDHSWHDTQSLTPVLPVIEVVGKLTAEVVRVN